MFREQGRLHPQGSSAAEQPQLKSSSVKEGLLGVAALAMTSNMAFNSPVQYNNGPVGGLGAPDAGYAQPPRPAQQQMMQQQQVPQQQQQQQQQMLVDFQGVPINTDPKNIRFHNQNQNRPMSKNQMELINRFMDSVRYLDSVQDPKERTMISLAAKNVEDGTVLVKNIQTLAKDTASERSAFSMFDLPNSGRSRLATTIKKAVAKNFMAVFGHPGKVFANRSFNDESRDVINSVTNELTKAINQMDPPSKEQIRDLHSTPENQPELHTLAPFRNLLTQRLEPGLKRKTNSMYTSLNKEQNNGQKRPIGSVLTGRRPEKRAKIIEANEWHRRVGNVYKRLLAGYMTGREANAFTVKIENSRARIEENTDSMVALLSILQAYSNGMDPTNVHTAELLDADGLWEQLSSHVLTRVSDHAQHAMRTHSPFLLECTNGFFQGHPEEGTVYRNLLEQIGYLSNAGVESNASCTPAFFVLATPEQLVKFLENEGKDLTVKDGRCCKRSGDDAPLNATQALFHLYTKKQGSRFRHYVEPETKKACVLSTQEATDIDSDTNKRLINVAIRKIVQHKAEKENDLEAEDGSAPSSAGSALGF